MVFANFYKDLPDKTYKNILVSGGRQFFLHLEPLTMLFREANFTYIEDFTKDADPEHIPILGHNRVVAYDCDLVKEIPQEVADQSWDLVIFESRNKVEDASIRRGLTANTKGVGAFILEFLTYDILEYVDNCTKYDASPITDNKSHVIAFIPNVPPIGTNP